MAVNAAKTPMFSELERVDIIRKALEDLNDDSPVGKFAPPLCGASKSPACKIVVASTSGLITDYCKKVGASVIVKGLRQNGDYEAELGMALVNRKLAGIETMFLPADPILEHVSSSVVKDVARHGGDVSGMVPNNVIPLLQHVFSKTNAISQS